MPLSFEAPTAVFCFGRHTLDLVRGALFAADGAELALRPKSFALLRYMVENAGRLVNRDELMRAIWPGIFVTDESIAQCVKEVRRVLGDDEQRVLRTLPRRGYLLAIPVSRADAAGILAASAAFDSSPGPVEVLARPATGRPMVVVMPFESIASDPEHGYFADGLTTDLVTELTRFQDLHIISPHRRSGRPLRKAPRTAKTLPAGASFVLSGTVRRAEGRIRVTVNLNDARTGVGLWAERFDRPLDDLFVVQETLANRIAALLECQVSQEGLRRARRRPPASLDAYDLCLQARALLGGVTEANTLAARELLTLAIAADPDHAPAYAWQSQAVQRGFTLGWGEPRGRAALDSSLQLASRAAALEPDSSLCLTRLGWALSLVGRHTEALEITRTAISANPCDSGNRATHGEILSKAGDHEAGAAELQLAISLNPYHPPFWWAPLGRALLLAGRQEEALAELRRCAALAPDYRPCHSSIVVACAETGRLDEARAALGEVLRLRPGWVIRDYDGVWGFRREADTARFLAAFRAAGMPED